MARTLAWAVALGLGSAGAVGAVDAKVGHWNVYWKALGDPLGRSALVQSLDAAAASRPFDFFSLVEAAGNTPEAHFPTWLEASKAFGRAAGMHSVTSVSGFETVALLYHGPSWELLASNAGDMGWGRPYILGLFRRQNGLDFVWVMSAHTPHLGTRPGEPLASAFRDVASRSNRSALTDPFVIMGDFNEFGECSLPPELECTNPWYKSAAEGIRPLWDYFGVGSVSAAVAYDVTTCCTKWKEGIPDWHHHFDKVYYSPKRLSVLSPPERLAYTYPGIAGACGTAACTGDSPPGGVAPTAQGSWHRGWQAAFAFEGPRSEAVAVAYV